MLKRSRRALLLLLGIALLLMLTTVVTVQADYGVNWTGQFFNCPDLSCAPVVAAASYPNGLNFTWPDKPTDGLGTQLTAVNADNFSARFISSQNFNQATYQFVLFVDDGGRVFIDGVVVIDQFGPGHLGTYTINRDMTAGLHTIVVEYNEVSGSAIIQFQWFQQGVVTGTPGTAVPTGSPVPAATGTVTSKGLSVRTGPYLGATYITAIHPGTAYPISGRNRDEGIFTWYLVSVTTTQGVQTGWASGRFLTITGDPNSIPLIGSVFDQIDGAPDVAVRAIPRAVMNLRRRPSIRAAKLGFMPWGGEAQLIGRTVQGGKNFWFQVRFNGVVGWIFAPYVTIRGDVNAVPIR
jgi:uncharacterized protein YraI